MCDILLIEADYKLRNLIKAQLEEDGHRVTRMPGVHKAVEILRRRRAAPQLIIADVVGQDWDEHTLADLRAVAGSVPIILCIGVYAPAEADAQGVAAVLTRPFSIGDLAATVEAVLPGQGQPS